MRSKKLNDEYKCDPQLLNKLMLDTHNGLKIRRLSISEVNKVDSFTSNIQNLFDPQKGNEIYPGSSQSFSNRLTSSSQLGSLNLNDQNSPGNVYGIFKERDMQCNHNDLLSISESINSTQKQFFNQTLYKIEGSKHSLKYDNRSLAKETICSESSGKEDSRKVFKIEKVSYLNVTPRKHIVPETLNNFDAVLSNTPLKSFGEQHMIEMHDEFNEMHNSHESYNFIKELFKLKALASAITNRVSSSLYYDTDL